MRVEGVRSSFSEHILNPPFNERFSRISKRWSDGEQSLAFHFLDVVDLERGSLSFGSDLPRPNSRVKVRGLKRGIY
jgi:hypothetical protein